MIDFLHYHIAGIQPVFGTVGFSIPYNLAAPLFQTAKAPGESRFSSSIISNNSYNTVRWNFAFMNVKRFRLVFISKTEIAKLHLFSNLR